MTLAKYFIQNEQRKKQRREFFPETKKKKKRQFSLSSFIISLSNHFAQEVNPM
jgi:hypothetical protein